MVRKDGSQCRSRMDPTKVASALTDVKQRAAPAVKQGGARQKWRGNVSPAPASAVAASAECGAALEGHPASSCDRLSLRDPDIEYKNTLGLVLKKLFYESIIRSHRELLP